LDAAVLTTFHIEHRAAGPIKHVRMHPGAVCTPGGLGNPRAINRTRPCLRYYRPPALRLRFRQRPGIRNDVARQRVTSDERGDHGKTSFDDRAARLHSL